MAGLTLVSMVAIVIIAVVHLGGVSVQGQFQPGQGSQQFPSFQGQSNPQQQSQEIPEREVPQREKAEIERRAPANDDGVQSFGPEARERGTPDRDRCNFSYRYVWYRVYQSYGRYYYCRGAYRVGCAGYCLSSENLPSQSGGQFSRRCQCCKTTGIRYGPVNVRLYCYNGPSFSVNLRSRFTPTGCDCRGC